METFHLSRCIGIAALLILMTLSENVCLHTRKGYFRMEADSGPIMSEHKPYFVVTENSSFSLTCEGHRTIKWNSTLRNEDTRMSVHQRPVTKGFKSTLTIDSIHYFDTGTFKCFYKSDDSSTTLSASTYVYVTDSEHLLVPMGLYEDDLIIRAVHEGTETVIPCKPTHPEATVTLVKFPEKQILTQPGDVEFDPSIGFTLTFPDIFFNGLFECKAELGKFSQILNLHLLWLAKKDRPSLPKIDKNASRIDLENRTINLVCTVTIPVGEEIELTWIYPNSQNQHLKIFTLEQEEVQSKNGYTFFRMRRTLFASHLGTADGGRYACVATSQNNKTEVAEMYIPIESPARIIGSNMGGSSVNVRLGDEIKLQCQADGYPKPELRWYKNGVILDPLINRGYDLVDLQSKLIIEEVILSDSGIYKCTASNRGGTQTRNVTIVVTEPNHLKPTAETTKFVNPPHIENDARRFNTNIWWLSIFVIVTKSLLSIQTC